MGISLIILTSLLLCSRIRCDCNIDQNFDQFHKFEAIDNSEEYDYSFDFEEAIKCTNISVNGGASLETAINNLVDRSTILFVLNSSIPTLKGSTFITTNKLTKIYFVNTKTTEIQPKTFFNLKNLEEIAIIKNELRKIEGNALSEIPKLKGLDLSHNKLSSLEHINNISTLQLLNISYNQIKKINEEDLLNLNNLKLLDLSSNQIPELESNLFAKLINLEYLLLKNNSIRTFQIKNYVQRLSLAHNSIETIDVIDNGTKQLQNLDLSNNKIKLLKKKQFKSLKLKTLLLDANFIEEIDVDAFENLNNLITLALNENHLSNLYVGTFRFLSNLKKLLLSGNRFETFEDGVFFGLDNLQYLDLSNNRIQMFNFRVFYSVRNVNHLYLHGNFLHTFDAKDIEKHFSALKELSLDFKEIGCNNLAKIMRRLKDNGIRNGDTIYNHNVNGIHCDPNIQDVDEDDFYTHASRIIRNFNIAKTVFIFVVMFAILMLIMKIITLYDINLFSYCKNKIINRNREKLLENGAD